jgi:CRISPR-associated protein Cmr1
MWQQEYKVRFITPAFLGNAEQKGQWRTPPFKALIRQWWRILKAKDYEYSYVKLREKLREKEGELFGHTWLKHDEKHDEKHDKKHDKKQWSMRSRLIISLKSWQSGNLRDTQWPQQFKKIQTSRNRSVRSDVYLGFGPITIRRAGRLAHPPAVAPDSETELTLRGWLTEEEIIDLQKVMKLIHWFGSLGSRCRNGWGSLYLRTSEVFPTLPEKEEELPVRALEDCLELDWPHAIGSDKKGPLIWLSKELNTWPEIVNLLAEIKAEMRQVAKSIGDKKVSGIHLLGYPAGDNWKLEAWERQRLASPIRFKVMAKDKRYQSVIYHLPYGLPERLFSLLHHDKKDLQKKTTDTWKKIHELLDKRLRRWNPSS